MQSPVPNLAVESYDLFVSYARKDGAHVTPLVEVLVDRGLNVFIDICQWTQNRSFSMAELQTQINAAIEASRGGLIALSATARESAWVQFELKALITRAAVTPSFRLLGLPLDGTFAADTASVIHWLPHDVTDHEAWATAVLSLLGIAKRDSAGDSHLSCRHCWATVSWNAAYCPHCRGAIFPRCAHCGARGTCSHSDAGGGELYLEGFEYACLNPRCAFSDSKLLRAGDAVEGWQPNKCPYCFS